MGNPPIDATAPRHVPAARALPLVLTVVCVCVCASACVSPATTLQTAKTTPPGDVEVTLGGSVPIHGAYVGALADLLIEAGERIGDADSSPLTEQEQRDAVRSALAAVLFQPAFVYQLELRTGILPRLDAGFRVAGPSIKGDLKLALYAGDSLHVAATAGYVHHTDVSASFASSVYTVFNRLRIADYSRRDLDVAVIASGDPAQTFAGYGALRYVAGFASLDTAFADEVLTESGTTRTDTRGVLHTFGVTGGMRLGSPRFAVLAELGLMWLVFEPTIMGARADLGGILVTPAFAFDARF